MYIPAYVESHELHTPGYLGNKIAEVDDSSIPHIDGIEWTPLPEIFFLLGQFEKIIDFCVLNKRPILMVVEGPSGEAKTSLVISLLGWALWRYSKTPLTVKNFRKYFLLGKYISLRPDIIKRHFKAKQFFVVDEAHLMLSRMRASSKQNRDAHTFADTIREEQIFAILVTIFSGLLDNDLVNYKVMIRFIVKYNSQKKNRIFYDVQINAKGIGKDGKQKWEYIPLEKNRMARWCPSELWEISKSLKQENVMGGSIKTIRTYDNELSEADKELSKDVNKNLETGVFTNYTEMKDWIRQFYRAGYNLTNIRTTINVRLEEQGEKLLSWNKLKMYIKQIDDE